MKLELQIKLMRELAHDRHNGQFRNDGISPYVTHVEAVADAVEDRLKPIALGHDILENTSVTLDELKKLKFPVRVIIAIDLLTHKVGVSNVQYWTRIAANADATTVKIADIKDNLSSDPSSYAMEKYIRALALFKSLGYSA